MNEAFNLERKTAMKEMIDPTGKKWELHGQRGSSLVHARPNPDRSDAQIPKEFSGQWTSPTVLVERITAWLNRQWDASDEQARINALRAGRTMEAPMPTAEELAPEPKQTPEESLAALDPEIAAELGDLLAVEEPEAPLADMKIDELRALATPLGVKSTSKAILISAIEASRKE